MGFWLIVIFIAVLIIGDVAHALKRAWARCPHGVRGGKSCRLCEKERLQRDRIREEERQSADMLRQARIRRYQEKELEQAVAREAELARLREQEFRRLRDTRALQHLDPYAFEMLCATLYQRMGWNATTTSRTGDGGIDVVISRPGEKKIVQCKRFTTEKVGVGVVRDLFGVVTANGANGGILVTTTTFTEGAIVWGKDKRIEFVDCEQLVAMVRQHFPSSTTLPDVYVEERASALRIERALAELKQLISSPCPQCGKRLAIREGRRGRFLGCTGYPACRYTHNIPEHTPLRRQKRRGS